MKKLLPFILFLGIGLIANQQVSAQCVPDSTLSDSVFISPSDLPDGIIGFGYDEIISFRFPKDTMVDTMGFQIEFSFCSFTVDSVAKLPAGMTFECDKPDCIYEIDHTPGVINRGCARISGIPTDSIDNDTLEIYVTFVDGNVDETTFVCTPDNSPILQLLQPVLYETKFTVRPAVTSIEDLLSTLNLSLYPNPAFESSTLMYELKEAVEVEINVFNLLGEKVIVGYQGRQLPGTHEQKIETGSLEAGIYLVQVQLDHEHVIAKKLIVQ